MRASEVLRLIVEKLRSTEPPLRYDPANFGSRQDGFADGVVHAVNVITGTAKDYLAEASLGTELPLLTSRIDAAKICEQVYRWLRSRSMRALKGAEVKDYLALKALRDAAQYLGGSD
jgi:hypothetical protein